MSIRVRFVRMDKAGFHLSSVGKMHLISGTYNITYALADGVTELVDPNGLDGWKRLFSSVLDKVRFVPVRTTRRKVSSPENKQESKYVR